MEHQASNAARNGQAARQRRWAAARGWIGSMLDYNDSLIYATAASLIVLFSPMAIPTLPSRFRSR
jgi:hypothetical protein